MKKAPVKGPREDSKTTPDSPTPPKKSTHLKELQAALAAVMGSLSELAEHQRLKEARNGGRR